MSNFDFALSLVFLGEILDFWGSIMGQLLVWGLGSRNKDFRFWGFDSGFGCCFGVWVFGIKLSPIMGNSEIFFLSSVHLGLWFVGFVE